MILNVHRTNPHNLGDMVCSPLQWFPDLAAGAEIYDVINLPKKTLNADMILGGGGLGYFEEELPLWAKHTSGRKIAWGMGCNTHGITEATYPISFSEFDLVGLRDWGTPYEWVPCPSCMSPLFDEYRTCIVDEDVVCYWHAEGGNAVCLKDKPTLTNAETDLEKVLDHLSRGSVVVTNTYHGAYWATLLGCKVIVYEPFSSRFFHFKHKPAYTHSQSKGELEFLLAHPDEIPEYPGALKECRSANLAFYKKVKDLLSVGPSPESLRKIAGYRRVRDAEPVPAAKPANQAEARVFTHSGDYGDLVYALPVIRDAGGGHLYLYEADDRRARAPMTAKHAAGIIPLLLEGAPYLKSVTWGDKPMPSEFNDFRKGWDTGSIIDWHYRAANVHPNPCPPQWLDVEPKKQAPVIIARSARYHNEAFPWRHILEFYGNDAMFVGTQKEAEALTEEFGVDVTWLETANLLELARVIAGAELFIGNQSCPLAIAEAVKVPKIIAECWPDHPNCSQERPGRINWLQGNLSLPDLLKPVIGALSLATDEIAPIREISFPNKASYCSRHGYIWVPMTNADVPSYGVKKPSWYKLMDVLQAIDSKRFHWIWWTDADSVICQPWVKLETFIDEEVDLIVAHDSNGINFGQFLIRSCEAAAEFLRMAWDMYPKYEDHPWFEQAAVQELVRSGNHRLRIKIITQREFNCYPTQLDRRKNLPFCLHCAGGGTADEKAEVLREAVLR